MSLFTSTEKKEDKHMYAVSNDYIIDVHHRNQFVVPYWHFYKTSVKKRWEGKSLGNVLFTEWSYLQEMFDIASIESYCKNKQILINNKQCNISQILHHDDYINVYCHKHEPPITYNKHLNEQEIGSLVPIHETNNILVILKPSTIPTHSTSLYHKNSIMTMLQNGYISTTKTIITSENYYNPNTNNKWFNNLLKKQYAILKKNNFCLLSDSDIFIKKSKNKSDKKYFTVHRLDRLTSGLLIIAKNSGTAAYFAHQFKHRLVKKEYLAVVHGKFDGKKYKIVRAKTSKSFKSARHRIILNKNGRDTETRFKLIWYNKNKNISLISCIPFTGRTHQIRVHLANVCKTPIINDPLYDNMLSHKENKFVYDKKVLNHVNKLAKNANGYCSTFKCNVCDNKEDSINLWWDRLSRSTSVSNNGIYLHAFKYTAIDGKYQYQTPVPFWACPPDNTSTQIFLEDILLF